MQEDCELIIRYYTDCLFHFFSPPWCSKLSAYYKSICVRGGQAGLTCCRAHYSNSCTTDPANPAVGGDRGRFCWAIRFGATPPFGSLHCRQVAAGSEPLRPAVATTVAGVKSCHLPACFRSEASRAVNVASQWQLARPDPSPRCACGQPMRVPRRRLPPLHPSARPDGQSEGVTLPDKPDQEQVHTTH